MSEVLNIDKSTLPCDNYTIDEFNKHIMEFRELMGRKSFWEQDDNVIENAVKSISYVYMHTVGDDERVLDDSEFTSYSSAIKEFEIRKRYYKNKLNI